MLSTANHLAIWNDFRLRGVQALVKMRRQLVNNRCVTYMISKYGVSIVSELNTTFIGVIDKEVQTLVQVTGTLLLPVSQGRRCSELTNVSFNSSSLRVSGNIVNKCADELCSITSPYTESYSLMNYDGTSFSIAVLQNYSGDVTLSYCCGSDCRKYSVNIFPNNTGGIEYTTLTTSFVNGVYTPFKMRSYADAAIGLYNLLPNKNKVMMWVGVIIGVIVIIIGVIVIYYILSFCYIPTKFMLSKLKGYYSNISRESTRDIELERAMKRLKYE
jgi:hypothetical protein